MKDALFHVRGNLRRPLDGTVIVDPDKYLSALIDSAEKQRDRLAPHLLNPR